ncbi:MAG: hypothetical protein AAF570_06350, partial [Bacteroidota bacterium]
MSTTTKVEFIQSHQPKLDSGKYKVTVEHNLSGTDVTGKDFSYPKSASQTFFVAGERFQILPAQVASVFPPHLSIGDHSNVFPHIMISRTTLPWEREAISGDTITPWMALLVIHEEEMSQIEISTTTASALLAGSSADPYFPSGGELEPGQASDQKVTVLDIEKSLLAEILPDKTALNYLSHVRQALDAQDTLVGEEIAALIANRMPVALSTTNVFLVSLENRYDAQGDFDFQGAADDAKIRLVQLYNWKFTCTDPAKDFPNLVKNLDITLPTLRKPDTTDPKTNAFLAQGFYPLPHKLRQGGQTVSWYHGPLAPGPNNALLSGPAHGSDALLRYYPDNGMFDASYAAAWELG